MKALRTLLLSSLLVLNLSLLRGQNTLLFEDWQEVVVFGFSSSQEIPWTGGFNSPQFSNLDVDLDGTPDLLVFDRIGNRILPFLQKGTAGQPVYEFAPQLIDRFPDLEAWLLVRDYDGDGAGDLFTHHPEEGIRVFRNTSSGGDSLTFEPFNFGQYIPTVRPGSSSDLLKVLDIDIPGIADLDNDGDLDILSFDQGGAFLEYHKNLSVESYGHADSLAYVLEEACWGHVQEDGTINAMQLGVFCKGGGVEEQRNRHLGGSILIFDEDGDGDKEVMIGDPGFNDMVMLTNGGDSSHADITIQTNSYPASNPVLIDYFPASFLVDIDNDGTTDMLASTNAQGGAKNTDHIWYYNNAGSSDNPLFYFFQSDFLIGETLDFGEGAFPVWVDYDHDGRTDILVANNSEYNETDIFPRIYLYRNSGNDTLPRYEMITDDVADLYVNQTYNPGLYPTMGDIDGDGDEDLFLGQPNGRIDYFENVSVNPNAVFPTFNLVTFGFQGIDVGSHATPQLTDVDRDGLLDLVIGEKDGNLNYYRNEGSSSAPQFTLVSDAWGQIDVSRSLFQDGYSYPAFYWEEDTAHVMIGSDQGLLYHYASMDPSLQSAFFLVDSIGVGRNLGKRTAPSMQDMDDDGDMDLLVGNFAGGLNLFRQTGTSGGNSVSLSPAIPQLALEVAPIPAREQLSIKRERAIGNLHVRIMDMQGRIVWEADLTQAEETISVRDWGRGIYLMHATSTRGAHFTQKILISPERG